MNLTPVIYTCLAIIPIQILDQYLKRSGIYYDNHRWCFIHSVVNLVVVLLSFRGFLTMLSTDLYQQQMSAPDSGFTIWSSILVMAAHIYHVYSYRITDMSLIIHHYLMMAVLAMTYFNTHNQSFLFFTDYSLFFLCGLPGMIDYYCMHLCYSGNMERIQEKRINNFLNTYIRAPGILYGAFYIYRLWINGYLAWYYALPVIFSFVWNAQFFSNAVAVSYGYSLSNYEN